MNIRSKGFSLIEIMITLTIASLITLLLYQSLDQSRRLVQRSETALQMSAVLPRAYNQLEKDLTALFVPAYFFYVLQQTQKKEGEKKDKEQKETEKKLEQLKDIFSSTVKEKNMATLTFFSTHSLSFFGSRTPYAARVVYRLVPQENNLFTLMRQESTDIQLTLDKFKEEKIRAYPLLKNIRTFSAEFIAYREPEKKEKEGKESAQKKEKKREETRSATWSSDERIEKKESLTPAFVQFKGIVADEAQRRDYEFEWLFEIFVYDGVIAAAKASEKSEKKTPPEEQKPEKQKQQNQKEPNTAPVKKQAPPAGGRRR